MKELVGNNLKINKSNAVNESVVSPSKVTVGRFACDVTVQDAKISRNHCSLKHIGKNWILTDLKSLNGTYFGNKRLKPKVSYPLRNGIMFSIGPPQPTTVTAHTTFLFTCEEDKEQKMLKRKFDEQNSDEAMQDSQRTAVPSISPFFGWR
ncbi:hypothetical protein TNCV_1131211 [Trichonephila clavipes]|nr:hypothetical protein TNCV_1131211 [Trichonephila clavipes]